jgi:hypothetical protein
MLLCSKANCRRAVLPHMRAPLHPEIMAGTPVYRGTRIPLRLVAGMLAQAASVEEIPEGCPALRREKDRVGADLP